MSNNNNNNKFNKLLHTYARTYPSSTHIVTSKYSKGRTDKILGWVGIIGVGGGGGESLKVIQCSMIVSAVERTARIVQALFSPGGPLFGLVPQSYKLSTLHNRWGDSNVKVCLAC
jgi:hypothetical protein